MSNPHEKLKRDFGPSDHLTPTTVSVSAAEPVNLGQVLTKQTRMSAVGVEQSEGFTSPLNELQLL